jgi:hypothetical protein
MDKTDRGNIIVDAALKVFSRKRYADTRMADIAREAGIFYGRVYHYFTYVFLGSIDTFLSVMILGKETPTPGREKRIIEGITQVFLHGAATK